MCPLCHKELRPNHVTDTSFLMKEQINIEDDDSSLGDDLDISWIE